MKNRMYKSIKVILPIIFILLFSCATTPKILPPPEEFRANLGTIGVVSACFQPEVGFQKPMTKGAAASYGAGAGSLVVLRGLGGANFGSAAPGAALVALGLIPVGAAVGSIIGVANGVRSQKIKETEDALNSYLLTINFQETMRERFFSVAREQTQNAFVLIEGEGPNVLDEEVTYDSLSDKGIDTVLEISVRRCGLQGGKGINPPLRLLMAVGTRLIRIADGKVLWSRIFIYEYESPPREFSEWGANSAQLFREELDRAFSYLATVIVDALSMIQTPPDPQPTEDSQG